MSRVRMVPRLEAPERWVAKKPTRLWAALVPGARLRSFTTRDAAEHAVDRANVKHRGAVLLRLWFDGCVKQRGRRVLRGFLTQWVQA